MDKIVIKIKTDYFDPETILDLNNDKKVSFIYGTNGSGKTTISSAISYLKDKNLDFDGEISFVDSSYNPFVLDEENLKNLFVFNENFIDRNIKEKATGISSIVILGDNVEVDNKIDQLKAENKKITDEIEGVHFEKYTTHDNPSCIDDIKRNIVKVLKESYAERGRQIEGRLSKIPATEKTIDEIRKYKNSNDLVESLSLFDKQLSSLLKMRGKEIKLDTLDLNYFPKSDDIILELLNFNEDVNLKESLKNILTETSDKYGYEMLSLVKNDIDSLEYCPLCFRPFDKSSRDDLKHIIHEIFDQRASEIESLIGDVLYNLKEIVSIGENSPYFNELDNKFISSLNSAIYDYNSVVRDYCAALKKKSQNIKKGLNFSSLNLDKKTFNLKEKLNLFNLAISDYNFAIDNFKKSKDNLKILNCEIAYREAEQLIKSLDKLTTSFNSDKQFIEKKNSELENNLKAIRELEQKKRNTQIAIKNINRNLKLIYNDKNRLKIVLSESNPAEYLVLSRGKKVKPNKLSAGERNAIALCYFYETIKSNRDETSVASENNIIIIDDPVTSLDYDAKVGIYSFLGKMMDELKITSDQCNSIFVVLTHDYETVQKLYSKIDKGNKCYVAKLCRDKSIKQISNPKNYSNYADLLYSVFEFANSNNVDSNANESILNIARKTFEAYATFNYRNSFFNVLKDESILSTIGDDEAAKYFKHQSFKFLLNPGSHEEYQTNLIPDVTEEPFDAEVAQGLLKDLLIFIYLTNRDHIICNLHKVSLIGKDEIEGVFKNWLRNASWKD